MCVIQMLTVKGGVHPFPIVPPPALNEGGSFLTRLCARVCVCVRVCDKAVDC